MVLRWTWRVRLSRTKWPRMVKRIGSLWTEMAAQVGCDGDDMVDAWLEKGGKGVVEPDACAEVTEGPSRGPRVSSVTQVQATPGGTEGDGELPARPDVFVSYAREDAAFVQHLSLALAERDKTTWVDVKDIPPTAEWRAEVEAAIESTDAFVAVMSPDSLLSAVCAAELAHAVEHNKRIIPRIGIAGVLVSAQGWRGRPGSALVLVAGERATRWGRGLAGWRFAAHW
jgi:TIR domain